MGIVHPNNSNLLYNNMRLYHRIIPIRLDSRLFLKKIKSMYIIRKAKKENKILHSFNNCSCRRIRMTSDRQQCFLLYFFLNNCVLSLSCVDVCECCYFTFTLFFSSFFFVMMSSSHSLLCLTSYTLLLWSLSFSFFPFL